MRNIPNGAVFVLTTPAPGGLRGQSLHRPDAYPPAASSPAFREDRNFFLLPFSSNASGEPADQSIENSKSQARCGQYVAILAIFVLL